LLPSVELMAGVRMSRTGNNNKIPLERALALVIEAMDLLDGHDGPLDAAAHLDLVRERLVKELGSPEN
jgi:hypothetical protein